MLIFENISLALQGLFANKMRALLTMLGIIIGIASVIAIMTVGNSISSSVTDSMESMGASNITLGVQQKSSEEEVSASGMRFMQGGMRSVMSEEDYLSEEMLTDVKETFAESVWDISISENVGSGTAQDGAYTANVQVTGANGAYLENEDLNILAGRLPTEKEQEEGKKVVLVTDKVVENLYGTSNWEAIGSQITVLINNRYYNYSIVGVYEYEESAMSFSTESDSDVTTTMYLPLEAARDQNHTKTGFSQVTLLTISGVDVSSFCEELETYMNNRYYRNNESYEVSALSMESIVSSMTEMLSTISIAISIIAGISLLVGGIGVMNIMLVSITERTREIGTRKALGATNGSIRLQFIMESVVICLIGGIIGILLGIALATVATNVMGYAAYPSVSGIIFSVSFSVFIGVFFGYYPANKAAKMNPIEALRYE